MKQKCKPIAANKLRPLPTTQFTRPGLARAFVMFHIDHKKDRYVVRDDKTVGGTKVRVLKELFTEGFEYVYATPAYGHAQIAIAIAAEMVGARCALFVAKRKTWHANTQLAANHGAVIHEIPYGYLSNITHKAKKYAQEGTGLLGTGHSGVRVYLPFGLDTDVFISKLVELTRSITIEPSEVWCVAGSGVLTRSLQQRWPGVPHHAVVIGAEPNAGDAKLWYAPEKYEQDAKHPPPYPSCTNYDAKAWQFFKAHSKPGALLWNVAGPTIMDAA